MIGSRQDGARALLPMLAAAVLLLLSAVAPQGWMPRASDGGLRLVMCTAAGAVPLVVDLGEDQGSDPGKAPEAPVGLGCPFGAAHASLPHLPGDPPLPSARWREVALPPTGPPAIVSAARAVRLPPSQAPPVHA